jgi:hypothetical protein
MSRERSRTRVIRADEGFADIIESGRRSWQASSGYRITTPVYTARLAGMIKPLLIFDNQAMNGRFIGLEGRGKRRIRA